MLEEKNKKREDRPAMLRRKKSNGSGASGELELLFLGLEGAGKTLLIRRLKHHTLLAASSKQRKKAKEAISFSTDVVPTVCDLHFSKSLHFFLCEYVVNMLPRSSGNIHSNNS